jgi:hypothetical protein
MGDLQTSKIHQLVAFQEDRTASYMHHAPSVYLQINTGDNLSIWGKNAEIPERQGVPRSTCEKYCNYKYVSTTHASE